MGVRLKRRYAREARVPQGGNIGPATLLALSGDTEEPPLPSEEDWASDVAAITTAGLAGAALAAVRKRGLPIPRMTIHQLEEANFTSLVTTMIVEHQSAGALRALAARGISFLVFKGPAFRCAGFDMATRPFSDIDILVRPKAFRPTLVLLEACGYSEAPQNRQPYPYLDRWCREAVNLRHPNGGSIDLHHHIPPWRLGRRLDFDVLWRHSMVGRVSDLQVRVPSTEHLFAITILHFLSDKNAPGASLRIRRDLALLVETVEPERAVQVLGEAGLGRTAGWVLKWIAQGRGWEVSDLLQRRYGSDPIPWSVRVLTSEPIRRRKLLGQIVRLPALHALGFILGYAFPSQRFLADGIRHVGGRSQWWAEGLRSLWRG